MPARSNRRTERMDTMTGSDSASEGQHNHYDESRLPRNPDEWEDDDIDWEEIYAYIQPKPVRIPRRRVLEFGQELEGFLRIPPNPRLPHALYVSALTDYELKHEVTVRIVDGQPVYGRVQGQTCFVGVPLCGFNIVWFLDRRADGYHLVPRLEEFYDLPDDTNTDGLLLLKDHLLARWGIKEKVF